MNAQTRTVENPTPELCMAHPLHEPGQHRFPQGLFGFNNHSAMQGSIYATQAGQGSRATGASSGVPGGAPALPAAGGTQARTAASNFRQALEVAGSAVTASADGSSTQFPSDYRIQTGDTLTAIVRSHLQAAGYPATPRDIHRGIGLLAAANAIADPDRIYAGNLLDLGALKTLKPADTLNPSQTLKPSAAAVRPATAAAPLSAHQTLAARVERVQTAARSSVGQSERPVSTAQLLTSANLARSAPGHRGPHTQLEKTLDRAVARGFIEPKERGPVRDRVVELAQKYRFSPDDFATVALMESDGFNPRASNGRCHGIIQFCEGSGRGAASVGLQNRASEILERPVLEQIELVDRYFADVGLKESSDPVGLVDLYLTVLTPAARATRQADAALPVGGVQAKALHVSGERERPITRNSILTGLQAHARAKLAELTPAATRPQGLASNPTTSAPDSAQRVDRRAALVDRRAPLVDASGATGRLPQPST
jgi:hypothetical protein